MSFFVFFDCSYCIVIFLWLAFLLHVIRFFFCPRWFTKLFPKPDRQQRNEDFDFRVGWSRQNYYSVQVHCFAAQYIVCSACELVNFLIMMMSLLLVLSLVSRLQVGEVVTTIPTIGFNVEQVTYKNLKFQVWDLGGQTSIR